MLFKVTASHMKDGVRQSETFADGHCVRHTVRVRHELCVAFQTNVAQFLSVTSGRVSLSAVAAKEYPHSVRIFM